MVVWGDVSPKGHGLFQPRAVHERHSRNYGQHRDRHADIRDSPATGIDASVVPYIYSEQKREFIPMRTSTESLALEVSAHYITAVRDGRSHVRDTQATYAETLMKPSHAFYGNGADAGVRR